MSDVLSFATPLLNSILGFLYFQKLLRCKYKRVWIFLIWIAVYFSMQLLMSGAAYPNNVFWRAALSLTACLIMSFFLFYGEREVRLFAVFSFIAGSEIVRFISIAINSILHGIFILPLYDLVDYTSIETAEQSVRRILAYTDVTLILSVFLQFTILLCYLYLIAKQFVLPYRRLPLHEKLLFILPSFTAMCVSVTLHMVVISMESGMSVLVYDTAPATRFWIPLICLLLLCVVISSAVLFQKMLRHNEDEKNRLLLQKQLAEMQNEVREIQDIYGDIRGLQHDMRDHIMNIHALMENGDTGKDELCTYMDRMEQTLGRLDFPVKTGSLVTDIIISRKRKEAEEKGIPLAMDFLFPANLQIDAYDIGVVLNNAFANAMEAAEQFGGGLTIRSYAKGSLFFLETENRCASTIRFNKSTGLPLSSKEDADAHGIGLASIRRCAQKYKGDIDIRVGERNGEQVFQLTVMMNGSGTTDNNFYG